MRPHALEGLAVFERGRLSSNNSLLHGGDGEDATLPLLPHFGVDPLFFGILVALNLQTSFLTPQMAMSAYYLKGVAPKFVLLWTIFRGCFPFVALVFLTMFLVYSFPQFVDRLPNVFYGN